MKKIILIFISLCILLVLSFLLTSRKLYFYDSKNDQNVVNEGSDASIIDAETEALAADPQKYWSDWNWEDNIVYLTIESTSEASSTVNGRISGPAEHTATNTRSYAVSCDLDQFSIRIKAKSVGVAKEPSGVGFFSNAKKGDVLVTKCLDESCQTLGGPCLLRSN